MKKRIIALCLLASLSTSLLLTACGSESSTIQSSSTSGTNSESQSFIASSSNSETIESVPTEIVEYEDLVLYKDDNFILYLNSISPKGIFYPLIIKQIKFIKPSILELLQMDKHAVTVDGPHSMILLLILLTKDKFTALQITHITKPYLALFKFMIQTIPLKPLSNLMILTLARKKIFNGNLLRIKIKFIAMIPLHVIFIPLRVTPLLLKLKIHLINLSALTPAQFQQTEKKHLNMEISQKFYQTQVLFQKYLYPKLMKTTIRLPALSKYLMVLMVQEQWSFQ